MVVYVSSVFSVFICFRYERVCILVLVSLVCVWAVCVRGRAERADSTCACMNNFSHSDDSKCHHPEEGKTIKLCDRTVCLLIPAVLVSNYLLVCVC